MDAIDELSDELSKGEARGGKYFRRVATGNAKRPYKYYYTKEQYQKEHGDAAHLHGGDSSKASRITNELRMAAQAEARKDSLIFSEEFPGEKLSGDWDAAAWSMAPSKLRDVDGLFNVYREHLHDYIALNNNSIRAQGERNAVHKYFPNEKELPGEHEGMHALSASKKAKHEALTAHNKDAAKEYTMPAPGEGTEVKLAPFRDAIDALERIVRVDYHANVNDKERASWADRASRVGAELINMTSARATAADMDRRERVIDRSASLITKVRDTPGAQPAKKSMGFSEDGYAQAEQERDDALRRMGELAKAEDVVLLEDDGDNPLEQLAKSYGREGRALAARVDESGGVELTDPNCLFHGRDQHVVTQQGGSSGQRCTCRE